MQRMFANAVSKCFVLAISGCLFAGLIVIPWLAFHGTETYMNGHPSLSLGFKVLIIVSAFRATTFALRAFGDTLLAVGRRVDQWGTGKLGGGRARCRQP